MKKTMSILTVASVVLALSACSNTNDDVDFNSENSNTETEDTSSYITDNGFDVYENEFLTPGYTVIGYIGEDPRLAVMYNGLVSNEKILIYDVDKQEVKAHLNLSDYSYTRFNGFAPSGEEFPEIYTEYYWNKAQVLDECLAVPKCTLINYGEYAEDPGFALFDFDLNPIEEIKEDDYYSILTEDAKKIIRSEAIIDEQFNINDPGFACYIYDVDDGKRVDGSKSMLYELEENEMEFSNCKADNGWIYTNITGYDLFGTACAIEIESGRVIKNSSRYKINQQGNIYPAGDYILFATGESDPTVDSSGSIVVFDKVSETFKEIKTESINETEHATITAEGRLIITTDYYRPDITDDDGGMIRVYDTESGELVASMNITLGKDPVCGDKKILIKDSGNLRIITFEEMGLS